MPFDLFQSRRNYNEKCKWWSRKEEDTDDSELVMKRVPSGTFWCMEVNAESDQNLIIDGTFMIDRTNMTIKSPDNLLPIQKATKMRNKVCVLFRGEIWIVESVQKSQAKKQNTLFASDNNCSHYWYLELRK